jgi:hypothetical protein
MVTLAEACELDDGRSYRCAYFDDQPICMPVSFFRDPLLLGRFARTGMDESILS